MSFENLSDDSVKRYYDQIKKLADDDRGFDQHFTASLSIRRRAETLREEMTRRRMKYSPISWPS